MSKAKDQQTIDTLGNSAEGFLFQSPDFKNVGLGLDDILRAQKDRANASGIYAPRSTNLYGSRGRPRTTVSGKMGFEMQKALADGNHVIFRGIPSEKAFAIIEKHVPKTVANNIRLLAPIIADGGFSMDNVVRGKYLGFTQNQGDGRVLNRGYGDVFNARHVTLVPYDMQFSLTLKDLKNPTQDYATPHFRFNIHGMDIDALNRRGSMLWSESKELQALYGAKHEFMNHIYETLDHYSGTGAIPATEFFGADEAARARRKHVVAAIGASPTKGAQLMFSTAEAEWHEYQFRSRKEPNRAYEDHNNPWTWFHADGLTGITAVQGERARFRMNEKAYYRSMVPTPTHEGSPLMQHMWQSPDREYSGRDDYWRTDRKDALESIDEQGYRVRKSSAVVDGNTIYHKDAVGWMKIGHGSNDKTASMWYSDSRGNIGTAKVSEWTLHDDLFAEKGISAGYKGRVDFPVYENGKLVKRGRISITENEDVRTKQPTDAKQLRTMKEKVAKKYGFKLDDVDAYYYGAETALRREFGIGAADKMPLVFQSADKLVELNYDALFGRKNGPNGPRNLFSEKGNLTPDIGGRRYNMTSEEWVSGFVGKFVEESGGSWDYTNEKGERKVGSTKGHSTAFKIRKLNNDGTLDISLEFMDEKGREYMSIGGELSKDKKSVRDVSVLAISSKQGNGYGNVAYSELLERVRAMGIENFDGEIINKKGAPAGLRDKYFGKGNSYIMAADWDTKVKVASPEEIVSRLQKGQDLGDKNGIRVRSSIDPTQFYQNPDRAMSGMMQNIRDHHDSISEKPYEVRRAIEEMNDPVALLKRLNKMEVFKTPKPNKYQSIETFGAKNPADAEFLASNFKYAAQKGDIFIADSVKNFIQQTSGSKDVNIVKHTLEEFLASQNGSEGINAYNENFKTGKPVAFVATHGTTADVILKNPDNRRNIKSLNSANMLTGTQQSSYAYSYGGPEFGGDLNRFGEGTQSRAIVSMSNPLVFDMAGDYMHENVVSAVLEKAKNENRDGIVMLNAIDPRVNGNAIDNHYILPKGMENRIAIIDKSLGNTPSPRGLGGIEGGQFFQNPDAAVSLPKGAFGPNNPETVNLSRAYKLSKGIARGDGKFIVKLNPEKAFKIGMEYERMKHDPHHPAVKGAYQKLAYETVEQYKQIIESGYLPELHMEPTEPYPNSKATIADIRDRKRLKVFSTDYGYGETPITQKDIGENPMLQMSKFKDANGVPMRINDLFRFVHDFFGHSERGNGFGPLGEENAWDVHARMFSPEARRAMTTETRGQNSWVNFVHEPNIEINRKRDLARALEQQGKVVEAAELRRSIGQTRFADQKIGLMPEWTSKLDEQLSPIERQLYGNHVVAESGFGIYENGVNVHSPDAVDFVNRGMDSKSGGYPVRIEQPEFYAGHELLMAGEGKAQVSISPEGELVSLAVGRNGKSSDASAVINHAIGTGKARWTVASDKNTVKLLNSHGFEAVARLSEKGKPDAIYMALVGEGAVPYEGPYGSNKDVIKQVSTHDEGRHLARGANERTGGAMMQNSDIALLGDSDKAIVEMNQLKLKYAEYYRLVESSIGKVEGFTEANKMFKLREWFNKNSPKENGKPIYSPMTFETKAINGKVIHISNFTQEHVDAITSDLVERQKAKIGATKVPTAKLTPEQINQIRYKTKVQQWKAEAVRKGSEWWESLSDDQKREHARKSKPKKEKVVSDEDMSNMSEEEIARVAEEQGHEEAYVDQNVQKYLDEGMDLVEATEKAKEEYRQAAKERGGEPIEFIASKERMDMERVAFDERTRMTPEQFAAEFKSDDIRDYGEPQYSDAEYLQMGVDFEKKVDSLAKDTLKGEKRSQPKEESRAGEGPTIEAVSPLEELKRVKEKYRNSEWFDEKGKSIKWELADGTIVNGPKPRKGSPKAVLPPELIVVHSEMENAMKSLNWADMNSRGISQITGLLKLWGFEPNINLADGDFRPHDTDLVREGETQLAQHKKLKMVLEDAGVLISQFEEASVFTDLLDSVPNLVDKTEHIIALLQKGAEFAENPIEIHDSLVAQFVDRYYDTLKDYKDEVFYKDAESLVNDKIRDKIKNFEDTNGRKPAKAEELALRKEIASTFNGRNLMNSWLSPEHPIDPKTLEPKKGWKEEGSSVEKGIRKKLRAQSDALKKSGDIAHSMTPEDIRTEARQVANRMRRDFVTFLFELANEHIDIESRKLEEKAKLRELTPEEYRQKRLEKNVKSDTGFDRFLEAQREALKKAEEAKAGKNLTDPLGEEGATLQPPATATPIEIVEPTPVERPVVEAKDIPAVETFKDKPKGSSVSYKDIPIDPNFVPESVPSPEQVRRSAMRTSESSGKKDIGSVRERLNALKRERTPFITSEQLAELNAASRPKGGKPVNLVNENNPFITVPPPEVPKPKNVATPAPKKVEAKPAAGSVEVKAKTKTEVKKQVERKVVKPPAEVAQSQVAVEQVGHVGARSAEAEQAVRDMLDIKDHLTLEFGANKRSITTKDRRYTVSGKEGKYTVILESHQSPYHDQVISQRTIAKVSNLTEAQLCIREFDHLQRVLAEKAGVNTSAKLQETAPAIPPAQAQKVAEEVSAKVKQNPQPPPAPIQNRAQLHPEYSNAVVGVKMSVKMSTADARRLVESAINKLGEKAQLADIIKQVLLDRQAIAAEVARANELFVEAANNGAGGNEGRINQTVITPTNAGLPSEARTIPEHNIDPDQPSKPATRSSWKPSASQLAAFDALTRFNTYATKYTTGNGNSAVGATYVNGMNYTIRQSGPSSWRVYNPAAGLMAVTPSEQEAVDAIINHHFKGGMNR
jgi:hypothetical protein